MSYCPNCGRKIEDESVGCPYCNAENTQSNDQTIIEGEYKETSSQTDSTESQNFSNSHTAYTYSSNSSHETTSEPEEMQTIHPLIKVLVLLLIIMTSGVGALVGIIGGLVMMKSPVADYRAFGKTMLTVSVVMIVVYLLCCVIFGSMGIFGTFFNLVNYSYY